MSATRNSQGIVRGQEAERDPEENLPLALGPKPQLEKEITEGQSHISKKNVLPMYIIGQKSGPEL